MEIWIIGGALVALMVYVSTRIKRSAAEAYEAEDIETVTYRLRKAAGFICPAGAAGPESLSLHSDAFGEREATESTRRAEAVLYVVPSSLSAIKEELRSEGLTVEDSDSRETIARGEVIDGDVRTVRIIKAVEAKDGRIFRLEARILADHGSEFLGPVEDMVGSFALRQ